MIALSMRRVTSRHDYNWHQVSLDVVALACILFLEQPHMKHVLRPTSLIHKTICYYSFPR